MGSSNETKRKEMEISSNEKIAEQNLAFQKEKFAYDKQLQQQIFDREDTAYQRTVNDMRSAGVSPLAMQGLNGAGSVVSTEAPQNGMVYDYSSGMSTDADKLNTMLSALGQISGVVTQAQEARSLRLQNDFYENTFQHRVAHEQAESILAKYNALDARDKRYFNNIFGVNSNMPREQQLANITATLSMSNDDFQSHLNKYSGKSLRDFEDSNFDFTNMLSYGSYDKRTITTLLDSLKNQATQSLGLDKIFNLKKKDGNTSSDRDKQILEKAAKGEKLSAFEKLIYYLNKIGIK